MLQEVVQESPADSAPPNISTDYVELFSDKSVVKRYAKKFNSRLDRLRHLAEVEILKTLVKGKILDCSVGSGRFIPHLKQVTEYIAADASESFLQFVKKRYPHVITKLNDLRYPLEDADNSYDTVMSIRTLFAIGPIKTALHEMRRVCKPGGSFIFDYPVVARKKRSNDYGLVYKKNKWSDVKNYQESPDVILDEMEDVTYRKIPLDMFFHYIKAGSSSLSAEARAEMPKRKQALFDKKRSVYRLFNSQLNILPDVFWLWYEKLSIKYPPLSFKPKSNNVFKRYLYVCTKQR